MPTSLRESLDALKLDPVLKKVLGETCFEMYITVKEKNLEVTKNLASDDRRRLLVGNI